MALVVYVIDSVVELVLAVKGGQPWCGVGRRGGYIFKSIIDYIIVDNLLMKSSSDVIVDETNIGSSDHYLVSFELGRNCAKNKHGRKWVVYR